MMKCNQNKFHSYTKISAFVYRVVRLRREKMIWLRETERNNRKIAVAPIMKKLETPLMK